MNPNDNSLMASIQQYYDMLNGVREQNMGLGNNQQLQNAQNQVNAQGSNLVQQLANMQVPQVSNMEYDPNNAQAALAQVLMAKGPEGFIPGNSSRPFGGGAATPGQMQAGIRDWQRALDNANFWDKSSFYGGGLKQLTPEEQQQKQIMADMAPIAAGQGLLSQLKPQAGVDPAQLGMMAELAQKDIASKDQLKGLGIKALADAQVEQAKNNNALQIAGIDAKSKTDTANIMANAKDAIKPDIKDTTEKQDLADKTASKLAQASSLAGIWDDKYFLSRQQAQAKLGDKFEKLGVPNDLKFKGYDEIDAKINDLIKDDVKEMAGARGMSNETAKKFIMQNLFDKEKDPSTAKANLANYLANLHVKDAVAKANLKFAKNSGVQLDENSDLFKRLNKEKMDSLSPEAYSKALDAVYEAHPNLYPVASGSRLAGMNDLTALQRELKYQKDPTIKTLIQKKIAALGNK